MNRRSKSPLYLVVKETFKNYNRGGKWNKEGMQAASQIYWLLITGAKNRHWRPWRDDSNHVSLKSQRPRAPRRRDDLPLWVRQILTRQSRLLAAALTDVIHSPWNWSCGMSYQQAQTVVLTVGQLTETLIISKTLSFDPCRKDASRLDVCCYLGSRYEQKPSWGRECNLYLTQRKRKISWDSGAAISLWPHNIVFVWKVISVWFIIGFWW